MVVLVGCWVVLMVLRIEICLYVSSNSAKYFFASSRAFSGLDLLVKVTFKTYSFVSTPIGKPLIVYPMITPFCLLALIYFGRSAF